MKKCLRILDIDLDVFLDNRYGSFLNEKGKRLSSKKFHPWKEADVVKFLENNCGLKSPTSGCIFTHHDELFYYLRELQEKNNYELTFEIDHVDAHADLGFGDSAYEYISQNLLLKSISDRAYPDGKGYDKVSKGNFLLFMIACRWVRSLHYINNPEWANDYCNRFIFKNFDCDSGFLQLKQFKPGDIGILNGWSNEFEKKIKEYPPITLEPEVPFSVSDISTYKSTGEYDLVFLTQSPNYTPPTSDILIDVIKRYIS